MSNIQKIAIIGGGAAGFFAAITAAENNPSASVTIFEKSSKLLAKVKVSGGGRCNVTHNQLVPRLMAKNYPRGENFLKKSFSIFSVQSTIDWFEKQGVPLKVEPDNRMFPETNTSQTIIDTLTNLANKLKVIIRMKEGVSNISSTNDGFELTLASDRIVLFDKVVLAIGGNRTLEKYHLASNLGHAIVPPVPSLFTFNVVDKGITTLMGLSVPLAQVKILGTKFVNTGPLLVTHWGFSGPAILKLSALAARELSNVNYHFKISINWLGVVNESEARILLEEYISTNGGKLVGKNPFEIPNRMWEYIIVLLGINKTKVWRELDKKSKNRIINHLTNNQYEIKDKTTFKEEFVTCGGVDLKEVNPKTLESKIVPGLFFAGEYLDIDGVTGGFNFQAAWTTGFIAGTSLNKM